MIVDSMRAVLSSVSAAFIVIGSVAAAGGQVDDDVQAALAAARARATEGDVVAQFSLGAFLYYGGTDPPQAEQWFRQAAAQGYAPAEFQMGQLYDLGVGVAQDPVQALAWYRTAASHGSAAGQRMVGDFYRSGRGVAPDPAEAVLWYRRAAAADDIRGQYHLAEMYFTGSGVPRDYASAYVWYAIAAGQAPLTDNRMGLLELRDIAAGRMAPEEVADAARRVAVWKPADSPAR
jgi:hypothetical protein